MLVWFYHEAAGTFWGILRSVSEDVRGLLESESSLLMRLLSLNFFSAALQTFITKKIRDWLIIKLVMKHFLWQVKKGQTA